MNYQIIPYTGVGPLQFGMSPAEAHKLVGTPLRSRILTYPSTTRKERREIYQSGMHLVFNEPTSTARLIEIGFSSKCRELRYGNMQFFNLMPRINVVRELATTTAAVMESVGILVFLDIGIALTGFHDNDEENLFVSVFEHGRWDDVILSMKPYIVP